MKNWLEKIFLAPVKRRNFTKWSAAFGGVAAVASGTGLPLKAVAQTKDSDQRSEVKSVWSACTVNCGSRCALRHQVKDDRIIATHTDNTGDDEYGNHQVRACLRGRSFRQRGIQSLIV